jgi:hypothetical protein
MSPSLQSYLAGTAGLAVLLAAAAALTLARPRLVGDAEALRRLGRVALLAIGVQALHFGEELATGFAARFPGVLGLDPWTTRFFVTFNLTCVGLWLLAVPALRAGWTVGLLPMWFLGLALAANAIVHPVLALRTGGYFPGLLSSPLAGLAGVLLVRALWRSSLPSAMAGDG